MVNFNQFRTLKLTPDLPIVKVIGEANFLDYEYFSTEKADWTFDENFIIVPLLNFERFKIELSWRSGGFSTSFQGFIGVFQQTNNVIRPHFILPSYIPDSAVISETKIVKIAGIQGRLIVRSCLGKLESVSVYTSDGKKLLNSSTSESFI